MDNWSVGNGQSTSKDTQITGVHWLPAGQTIRIVFTSIAALVQFCIR